MTQILLIKVRTIHDMKKSLRLFATIAFLLITPLVQAAVVSRDVSYTAGSVALQGFVAYDDAATEKKPAILVIHDWMGISDFTRAKVTQLANDGYVAFAADIYGKNIHPRSVEEASKLVGIYKGDRPLLRDRVRAAFNILENMKEVDPKKIVVIGYCFGGTAALELARAGAQLAGTVSFHGGLDAPLPARRGFIKGPVLALHGAADPLVPPEEVTAFKAEMLRANVNLKFIEYPGAGHAFTFPGADKYNIKGVGYNKQADEKSWIDFKKFIEKIFTTEKQL